MLDAELRTPVSELVPAQPAHDAAQDRSADASAALIVADLDSHRSQDVDVLVRSTDDVTPEDPNPPTAPAPSTADTDSRPSLEETVERPVDKATVTTADYRLDTATVRAAASNARATLHMKDTIVVAMGDAAELSTVSADPPTMIARGTDDLSNLQAPRVKPSSQDAVSKAAKVDAVRDEQAESLASPSTEDAAAAEVLEDDTAVASLQAETDALVDKDSDRAMPSIDQVTAIELILKGALLPMAHNKTFPH
jgi:hypothetical protein